VKSSTIVDLIVAESRTRRYCAKVGAGSRSAGVNHIAWTQMGK
jgi:hypothetical protein